MKFLKIAACTIGGFTIFFGAQSAHAVTLAYAAPECDLKPQLAELEKIQGAEISKELEARKNLLNAAIDCGVKDVRALQAGLKNLVLEEDSVKSARDRLSYQLDQAFTFYRNQKEKVKSANIQESKVIARQLLEWRTSYYHVFSEKATSFIIWSKSQELMWAAGERLRQIEQTVQTLKLGDDGEIKNILKNAKDVFAEADRSHALAKNVFITNVRADDALDLTRDALGKLADIYSEFFKLSEAVNKIFPHY